MGREFVIDNLDDMCALMCDNVVPPFITMTPIDEIPDKKADLARGYRANDIRRFVNEFIDMATRYVEISVNARTDINNLRRRFQNICDTEYTAYGIKVVKRGDKVYLRRW